jgi:putative transposase
MPRANRYILPGVAYHLTHRCHDRSFLLKHGVDRTLYRQMLRERLGRHPVSLLGYCITSNHTHLLLVAQDSEADISRFMQSLEGDFAQAYNLRKKTRSGAFWGDRYHAVMVDTGEYLWRCLKYIDLNMVRAGKVTHPHDWQWCGYHELVGLKRRYCQMLWMRS